MSRVTAVLLAIAVALPVTAYVAVSVAGSDPPVPADHSPVILRDPDPADPTDHAEPAAPEDRTEAPPRQQDDRPDDAPGDADPARVVTPQPTPVGEDDDDEWDDDDRDDDGPGDDDTDGDDRDDDDGDD